jgi:hypothetical protein
LRDPKSAAVSPEADEARNELFLKRAQQKEKGGEKFEGVRVEKTRAGKKKKAAKK